MASLNFNSFRTEILNKGIQVAGHFDLEMELPPQQVEVDPKIPSANTSEDSELRLGKVTTSAPSSTLRLRCESVSLPDLSINTIETHRFGLGPPDIVPYGFSYFETVVTFIGDHQGLVYRKLYNWLKSIMTMSDAPTASSGILRDNTYEVGFKAKIVVPEAKINAYDHTHKLIYTVTLFDVFPRSLTTTSLNWAAGDEVVRYTMFLSFKDFKIDFPKLENNRIGE